MTPRRAEQTPPQLSRRERQIMDVVFRLGEASAADVHAAIPDAPTYTAMRGLLRILVEKGFLTQTRDGKRYLYRPSTSRQAAGALSLSHVVRTFFAGSAADAMAALLGTNNTRGVDDDELARLEEVVAQARRRRGKK